MSLLNKVYNILLITNTISPGGGGEDDIVVDASLSASSTNPVQNKAIMEQFMIFENVINGKANENHTHNQYFLLDGTKNLDLGKFAWALAKSLANGAVGGGWGIRYNTNNLNNYTTYEYDRIDKNRDTVHTLYTLDNSETGIIRRVDLNEALENIEVDVDISGKVDKEVEAVFKPSKDGETCSVIMIKEHAGTWLAATMSGIWRSTDEGFTWTQTNRTGASASVFPLGDGVWLAGGYGYSSSNAWGEGSWGIFRSTDDGLTWEQILTDDATLGATYPCPWSFARGPFTPTCGGFYADDVIVAGLTQKKGAIYSFDGGLTWNGGTGWTDINTALLSIHYDTNGGFPWNDGASPWVAGGGNTGESLGGLWVLGATGWSKDGYAGGSETHKVQALAIYTSKTGVKRVYWSNTSGNASYWIENKNGGHSGTPTSITSNLYYFIELADGYLYTLRWGDGMLLRINDEGTDFEPVTHLDGFHNGYALATNEAKTRLVAGYYGQGFATTECPMTVPRVDDVAEALTALKRAFNELLVNHIVNWDDVEGKPTSFTPATHTHTIANVTSLQTTLNGKASTSDVSALGTRVTALETALGDINTILETI